jgi:ATP-dependent Lon protease
MNEKKELLSSTDNNIKINILPTHQSNVPGLIEKKLEFFQDVIQKTILNLHKNKLTDILGVSEVNACINALNTLSIKIHQLINDLPTNMNTDTLITALQTINNELSSILKIFGTHSFDDLLNICFGNNNIAVSNTEILKYDLLKKYFHPTNYKVVIPKIKSPTATTPSENKFKKASFVDDYTTDKTSHLDCSDISLHVKPFYLKVHGIKVYIHNPTLKTTLLVQGVVDDIMVEFLNNKFINTKTHEIKDNIPSGANFQIDIFNKFITSLTLKDYLTLEYTDIYHKYNGYINQYKTLKQKVLSNIVNEFITSELFIKRNMLIQLLINSDNYDNKYMAYLLYDVLSNDTNGSVDTQEQIILFDSFPWAIKHYFRDAMKKTVQYTNDLSNFDINKIPLEQQICMLKANDNVKEKAMIKLKEVKAKSEDTGSKARQYLDGLLKIPFSSYVKEPIMNIMDENRQHFLELINNSHLDKSKLSIPIKNKYTSIEIVKYIKSIKTKFLCKNTTPTNMDIPCSTNVIDSYQMNIKNIKHILTTADKNGLIMNIMKLNNIITIHKLKNIHILSYSNKNKTHLRNTITTFIDKCINIHHFVLHELNKLCNIPNLQIPVEIPDVIQIATDLDKSETTIIKSVDKIECNFNKITEYISNVKSILDTAVHGHEKAKGQIERIIAQWVNGNHDGYCFGFEGAPGLGKTSLAKRGLSNCLKDENGNSRPFAMIAMGGDANGSTLHGHNYTYVGSTWGSIVQILMDKKCMNPIIFIDEVDKISKTEHGREIVGILTHLLDSTQNDTFQDKYFSGIDLDLSKVLFILSYNDVDAIDKILLDRIHRIKFTNLSLEDKLIIANTHMLPEIYKKFGLDGMIHFDNKTLEYIIENYTCEAGVRKMKERLFEIVGEINIDILKNQSHYSGNFPIEITIEDIKTKYFKDRQEVRIKKITMESQVGIANGMWANAAGQGGTLPIEAKFYPCSTFLNLKLTGMQGDVMQESMNVALTLAYNLTSPDQQCVINKQYNSADTSTNKWGIHLHTPEGSVSKNGPSAGSCITTVIYSLLNNKKIKYNFAMTGEISLDGSVTAIGGLDHKILGSIKAGVSAFIYPEENKRDFDQLMEKYGPGKTNILDGIQFYPVKRIEEIFKLILED